MKNKVKSFLERIDEITNNCNEEIDKLNKNIESIKNDSTKTDEEKNAKINDLEENINAYKEQLETMNRLKTDVESQHNSIEEKEQQYRLMSSGSNKDKESVEIAKAKKELSKKITTETQKLDKPLQGSLKDVLNTMFFQIGKKRHNNRFNVGEFVEHIDGETKEDYDKRKKEYDSKKEEKDNEWENYVAKKEKKYRTRDEAGNLTFDGFFKNIAIRAGLTLAGVGFTTAFGFFSVAFGPVAAVLATAAIAGAGVASVGNMIYNKVKFGGPNLVRNKDIYEGTYSEKVNKAIKKKSIIKNLVNKFGMAKNKKKSVPASTTPVDTPEKSDKLDEEKDKTNKFEKALDDCINKINENTFEINDKNINDLRNLLNQFRTFTKPEEMTDELKSKLDFIDNFIKKYDFIKTIREYTLSDLTEEKVEDLKKLLGYTDKFGELPEDVKSKITDIKNKIDEFEKNKASIELNREPLRNNKKINNEIIKLTSEEEKNFIKNTAWYFTDRINSLKDNDLEGFEKCWYDLQVLKNQKRYAISNLYDKVYKLISAKAIKKLTEKINIIDTLKKEREDERKNKELELDEKYKNVGKETVERALKKLNSLMSGSEIDLNNIELLKCIDGIVRYMKINPNIEDILDDENKSILSKLKTALKSEDKENNKMDEIKDTLKKRNSVLPSEIKVELTGVITTSGNLKKRYLAKVTRYRNGSKIDEKQNIELSSGASSAMDSVISLDVTKDKDDLDISTKIKNTNNVLYSEIRKIYPDFNGIISEVSFDDNIKEKNSLISEKVEKERGRSM